MPTFLTMPCLTHAVRRANAQDPYLEFLVLTSGGPFAPDTKVLTVVGAILLSVGVLFMGGMLLTICLCCICIRRALRRNSGLTYHQSVAYRIAQRCAARFTCMHADCPE